MFHCSANHSTFLWSPLFDLDQTFSPDILQMRRNVFDCLATSTNKACASTGKETNQKLNLNDDATSHVIPVISAAMCKGVMWAHFDQCLVKHCLPIQPLNILCEKQKQCLIV